MYVSCLALPEKLLIWYYECVMLFLEYFLTLPLSLRSCSFFSTPLSYPSSPTFFLLLPSLPPFTVPCAHFLALRLFFTLTFFCLHLLVSLFLHVFRSLPQSPCCVLSALYSRTFHLFFDPFLALSPSLALPCTHALAHMHALSSPMHHFPFLYLFFFVCYFSNNDSFILVFHLSFKNLSNQKLYLFYLLFVFY